MSKWIKTSDIENHKEADLKDWFKEKWVRVDEPKKDGKYQPCGRNDTSKGKKPVCVPVNKAKNLTEKERKNRVRQKRKKEKEPNPGKKPNTTTYTEQAGGKSNVSNNHNIRFVDNMISLSDFNTEFIKIALMGEEDETPTTDISNLFSETDKRSEDTIKEINKLAARILFDMVGGALTGPGDVGSSSKSFSEIFNEISNPDFNDMTEQDYLRHIKMLVNIRRAMYKEAVNNNDHMMQEIIQKIIKNNVNPFSFADVASIVRESVN